MIEILEKAARLLKPFGVDHGAPETVTAAPVEAKTHAQPDGAGGAAHGDTGALTAPAGANGYWLETIRPDGRNSVRFVRVPRVQGIPDPVLASKIAARLIRDSGRRAPFRRPVRYY